MSGGEDEIFEGGDGLQKKKSHRRHRTALTHAKTDGIFVRENQFAEAELKKLEVELSDFSRDNLSMDTDSFGLAQKTQKDLLD
jgi:hypothetical protein